MKTKRVAITSAVIAVLFALINGFFGIDMTVPGSLALVVFLVAGVCWLISFARARHRNAMKIINRKDF